MKAVGNEERAMDVRETEFDFELNKINQRFEDLQEQIERYSIEKAKLDREG